MRTQTSWICILAVGIVLGAANWTPATGLTYWHGKADTNWGNAGNWTGGVADTSSEVARFAAERVNQPWVGADYDIAALHFYNAGWEVHELGSHSLTLWGTSAVQCSSNIGTTYIYCDIELGSDQGWYIGANSTLYVSGIISRSHDLSKSGAGILHLGRANTFIGTATVSAGTLRMGDSAALPASTDVTVANGAVLDVNGYSAAIDALAGDGSVTLGAGILKVGNNSGSGTFSGVISGTGQLYKYGLGTQTLSGANIYTGKTKVYAGRLALGSAPDRLSDATDMYVAAGATFDMNGFNDTIDTLTGDGEVVTDGATLGVGGNNGSATFSGVISGTGGLTKAGLGTQALTNSNTYTGPTSIESGALRLSGSGRLDDATDVSVAAGATFELATGVGDTIDALSGDGDVALGTGTTLGVGGGNGSGTFAGVISGSGHFYKYGSGTQTLSGDNSYAGATRVYGGTLALGAGGECLPNTTELRVVAGATFDLNGYMETVDGLTGDGEIVTDGGRLSVGLFGGGGTFEGVISGTGELRKYGTGTQTLSGANSYTGPTNICGGMLAVSGASYRLSASTDVHVGGSATFYLNGFDERISDLTGSGTVTVLGGELGVRGGSTFDGVINGTGDFMKSGADPLTLTGTNEYIGTTTVDGLLIVDGSIASSSLTSVTDRGTLGGSGIVGPVKLYGTASPGTSAGILTVQGGLTMDAGLIQIELGGLLAGDEYDRLVVTGQLALDGDLDVLLIASFEPAAANTFDILDWSSLTGTFDNENLPALATGLDWDTSQLYTTGELRVVEAPIVVPEPAGLGLIGLVMMTLKRKRRRRWSPARS